MSYLLDTDVCSVHLRDERRLFSRFVQYSGRLHVSRVTIAELQVWIERAQPSNRPDRRDAVRRLLQDMTILEIDDDVCRRYGEIQADLIQRGAMGPRFDMLIAACALVHGLAVVTGNTADFEIVDGLSIVNWLIP